MNNAQRQLKARQIENNLQRQLLSFYRKIKPQLSQTTNFSIIKRQYERAVYETVREHVQQVHELGTQYVGEKLRTKTYTTESDVQLIKKETDDLVALFWKRINKDFERERERDFVVGVLTDPSLPPDARPALQVKPSFDTSFFVAGVATVAVTSALALATKQKAGQLLQQTQTAEVIPQQQAGLIDVRPTPTTKKEEKEPEEKKAKLRWFTQLDERVCFICRPLHGREWDTDDPDIPTPGYNGINGTHFGCRCYLTLSFD